MKWGYGSDKGGLEWIVKVDWADSEDVQMLEIMVIASEA